MRRPLVFWFCLASVSWAGAAHAQERGQIGLIAGYPGNVGVIWHVTDRIAVRPDFEFAHSSSDETVDDSIEFTGPGLGPGITFRTRAQLDSWAVSTRISGVVYITRWDTVQTFVAPIYGYTRTSTTVTLTTTTIAPPRPPGLPPVFIGPPEESRTTKATSHGHSGSGVFGVQFTPHRHFSAFGEVGVRYTDTSTSRSIGNSRNIGTVSSVGAILYF